MENISIPNNIMREIHTDETSQKLAGLNKLGVKAAETETETRKLFEPGEPKAKKGPGRPKKDKGDAPKADGTQPQPKITVIQGFDARDGCKGIFKMLSGALARSTKCPDMSLTSDEINELGDLWGQVGNQYMPEIIGRHGALIFACTATAGVAFRLSMVAENEIKKRQAYQQQGESKPQPGPVHVVNPQKGMDATADNTNLDTNNIFDNIKPFS